HGDDVDQQVVAVAVVGVVVAPLPVEQFAEGHGALSRNVAGAGRVDVPGGGRQLLLAPAFALVLGDDVGVDAAAHVPYTGQAHAARPGRGDQVVEDAVGHGLVEGALVAVAPDVELERLELDAGLVRHVLQVQGGEVGLAGHGADTGELGHAHADDE